MHFQNSATYMVCSEGTVQELFFFFLLLLFCCHPLAPGSAEFIVKVLDCCNFPSWFEFLCLLFTKQLKSIPGKKCVFIQPFSPFTILQSILELHLT